jgi:hypothetical protein
MSPRKSDLDLVAVEKAAEMIGRDRATLFRWFLQKRLTRHYIHDYAARVRRTAVDMNELRERMPGLLPAEDKSDG